MTGFGGDPKKGVKIRSAIASLPTYNAGQATDAFKGVELSGNENPYPPLPGVLKAAVAAAELMNRFPDPASAALIGALASFLDVPVERIAVGTGSVGVLHQLVSAIAGSGDEVVYAWRTFEAYPIIVQIAGATSVRVPLRQDERHDLDAMADAITDRTRLVLVCTPNNPTGTVTTRSEIERFLDRLPEDVLVVLDEAYVEFVRGQDCLDGIALSLDRRNVCSLRTFSKAYGLAGLRVGYAVAPEPVADVLRARTPPYSVNLLAQAAAVESLHAHNELMERVERLVAERDRVFSELRGLDLPARHGIEVPASQGNFYWLRLGERSAAFAKACEAAGVTVRAYAADGVRVTIGEKDANTRVLEVLRGGF
jgi:histidinol-phosphate aminotransferase